MGSVLRLFVHLRVEIRVENDYSVRYLQVDAMAACSGRQQENFRIFVLLEPLEVGMPVLLTHASV